MARKKKESAMHSPPVEVEARPVRLALSPEYHRLLRLVSADADTSMANFAQVALMKLLDDEAKQRGVKR